ncbi:PepSY domain-containing protein [Roseateles microcysteis]|uniref:PepSY domain-containing protein n=1 Tax=Roseateles microcysteis TaxID=3119057 RepID=UPI002FE6605D
MNLPFWVRRTHKWIGLVIGVQALLWMLSGVYMTVISLDVIHGDHLAHVFDEPLERSGGRLDIDQLAKLRPGFESFKLKKLLGKEVYELRADGKTSLVDARSGDLLSPLPREQIVARAKDIYQGEAEIREVTWITQAPQEVAKRPVPMWAVRFDDRANSTLYFSPDTGDLLARRHDLWRWFDFLWMFHIMDYDARTDVNNSLLRVAAGVGLLFALSGAWLVFYSFRRRAQA